MLERLRAGTGSKFSGLGQAQAQAQTKRFQACRALEISHDLQRSVLKGMERGFLYVTPPVWLPVISSGIEGHCAAANPLSSAT